MAWEFKELINNRKSKSISLEDWLKFRKKNAIKSNYFTNE